MWWWPRTHKHRREEKAPNKSLAPSVRATRRRAYVPSFSVVGTTSLTEVSVSRSSHKHGKYEAHVNGILLE